MVLCCVLASLSFGYRLEMVRMAGWWLLCTPVELVPVFSLYDHFCQAGLNDVHLVRNIPLFLLHMFTVEKQVHGSDLLCRSVEHIHILFVYSGTAHLSCFGWQFCIWRQQSIATPPHFWRLGYCIWHLAGVRISPFGCQAATLVPSATQHPFLELPHVPFLYNFSPLVVF